MEIALLSQVIPIQGPLLFPPACFRKKVSCLGEEAVLCSPRQRSFLHGVTPCIPGPLQGSEQLITPGQQPDDEAGLTLAVPLSLVPPVLRVPSCPEQQNARPEALRRDLLIKAGLSNPSVHSLDLQSRT